MKPLLYAVPSLVLFQCIPIETMQVISSISISLLRFLNFLKDAF
jgi:NADH:ubiquinone oxidoreductase subunit H